MWYFYVWHFFGFWTHDLPAWATLRHVVLSLWQLPWQTSHMSGLGRLTQRTRASQITNKYRTSRLGHGVHKSEFGCFMFFFQHVANVLTNSWHLLNCSHNGMAFSTSGQPTSPGVLKKLQLRVSGSRGACDLSTLDVLLTSLQHSKKCWLDFLLDPADFEKRCLLAFWQNAWKSWECGDNESNLSLFIYIYIYCNTLYNISV